MKKNGFLFFAIAFVAVLLIGFHAAPSGAATYDRTSLCQTCHINESAVLYHPGWHGGPVMCIECHQQNRTMCSDTVGGPVHSGGPIDIVTVACKGCHGADLCGSSFTEASSEKLR